MQAKFAIANKVSDGRRAERIRCNIPGRLLYMNEATPIRVIDLSKSGLCLQMWDWVKATPGSSVDISTNEFGIMRATVRWYRAGKMGLQIEVSSNTAAQIASYFKYHHRAATAVR